MIVKLLTEHRLEFLGLTGGCRGPSESTLVKMSICWKSHAVAHISLISLHSASYVRISSSVNNFRDMLPTIRLSPLRSPIIRKYTKPFDAFKRRGMYPNVSKCNAKRCVCCEHLCTKTTITPSVNGKQFCIISNNDMD